MLSFLNSSDVIEKYPDECGGLADCYDGCECDFALSHGTLVTRIFDDNAGYMLGFPTPVEEEHSVEDALGEITDYCMTQQISEVICDVPRDALGMLLRGVRHAEIHAMDTLGECFLVEIKNELSMLTAEIEFSWQGLSLTPPEQCYAENYGALVRDAEHNKYYGYEITDDKPNITAAEMVAEARRELESCCALTLFVSEAGDFIGEGVLYNFDGRGTAELSFRVSRDKCGRGYGRKILSALIEIARQIGLIILKARVHKENRDSLHLVEDARFITVGREGECHLFTLDLIS